MDPRTLGVRGVDTGLNAHTVRFAGWSNGRTPDSESGSVGSTPTPAVRSLAPVVGMVDTTALKAVAFGRAGSNPARGTGKCGFESRPHYLAVIS